MIVNRSPAARERWLPRLCNCCLLWLFPAVALADGIFVAAPRFHWQKGRDIWEPSQKAILLYDAGREDLVVQVKYEGPAAEFGWLIPVPGLPQVSKVSMKCFYELSRYVQERTMTISGYNSLGSS